MIGKGFPGNCVVSRQPQLGEVTFLSSLTCVLNNAGTVWSSPFLANNSAINVSRLTIEPIYAAHLASSAASYYQSI